MSTTQQSPSHTPKDVPSGNSYDRETRRVLSSHAPKDVSFGNTCVSETTYEIVVRRNGVFLTFTSGFIITEYRVQENIHRLLDYLMELIKTEYRGMIEVYVGTGTGKAFVVGLYHKTHPHNGTPLSESLFRFGDVFIPLSERGYIFKFIQELTNAMVEYRGVSGTQSTPTYILPKANLSVRTTGAVIETSLPSTTGVDKSYQSVAFDCIELIGMRDMLILARSQGRGSHVDGATFTNSLIVSGEGYIYRSTLDGKNKSTPKDIYLDKCHLTPLIKGLETEFADNKKFIAEIFGGVGVGTITWIDGKGVVGDLVNPYAKPKEEPKKEVSGVKREEPKPETKSELKPEEMNLLCVRVIDMLKYPLTVPENLVSMLGRGEVLGPTHMANCLRNFPTLQRTNAVLDLFAMQINGSVQPRK